MCPVLNICKQNEGPKRLYIPPKRTPNPPTPICAGGHIMQGDYKQSICQRTCPVWYIDQCFQGRGTIFDVQASDSDVLAEKYPPRMSVRGVQTKPRLVQFLLFQGRGLYPHPA